VDLVRSSERTFPVWSCDVDRGTRQQAFDKLVLLDQCPLKARAWLRLLREITVRVRRGQESTLPLQLMEWCGFSSRPWMKVFSPRR
jgi:hypothetical protein